MLPVGPKVRALLVCLLLTTLRVLAAETGPPPIPDPTPEQQRLILARVTRESLRYQRELPDLICTQLTKRTRDDTGTGKHWKNRDLLEVEDDYVGRFVNHKLLMMNGKDPKRSYQELTGFLSEAVLYSLGFLPRWIFGQETAAHFEWKNTAVIDGKPVNVFSVHLDPADSQLTLLSDRQSIIAGVDGFIYTDAATSLVQRFEIKMNLPAGSVIQEGFVRIDYGSVTISERQYLLPMKAEVTARVGGSLERNETQVVRYQKYASEANLKFDEAPDAAAPKQ